MLFLTALIVLEYQDLLDRLATDKTTSGRLYAVYTGKYLGYQGFSMSTVCCVYKKLKAVGLSSDLCGFEVPKYWHLLLFYQHTQINFYIHTLIP